MDQPADLDRRLLGAACVAWIAALVAPAVAVPAEPATNYDESAVRSFVLPDVLAGPDGRPATSAADWQARCRPHWFALLEQHVYGRRLPAVPVGTVGAVEHADVVLEGELPAIRIQARCGRRRAHDRRAPLPAAAAGPVAGVLEPQLPGQSGGDGGPGRPPFARVARGRRGGRHRREPGHRRLAGSAGRSRRS